MALLPDAFCWIPLRQGLSPVASCEKFVVCSCSYAATHKWHLSGGLLQVAYCPCHVTNGLLTVAPQLWHHECKVLPVASSGQSLKGIVSLKVSQ